MIEKYAAIKFFEEIFGFILLGLVIAVPLIWYVVMWILFKISERKERRRRKRERKEENINE